MLDKISEKAKKFRRTVSPVREIMSYADPDYIRAIGLDPVDLISFAIGGGADFAVFLERSCASTEIENVKIKPASNKSFAYFIRFSF